MTNQISKPGQTNAAPCQPLAAALALHLDGGAGQRGGPWALGWDNDGLKAVERSPAFNPTS
jgi:hypothetical protein